MSLLGKFEKGKIFIVSAPAGAGKTTLVRLLTHEFPQIKQSISFTTRPKRENEMEGVHYEFVTQEEFNKKIDRGDFLEFVKVHGHFYGTSKQWLEDELNKGHHVVLVIDTQGAIELMKKIPATAIFVKPPSLEVLRERLLNRQTDSKEEVERRMEWAEVELKAIPYYHYVIENEQLAEAYQVLKSVIIAEGHKQKIEDNNGK